MKPNTAQQAPAEARDDARHGARPLLAVVPATTSTVLSPGEAGRLAELEGVVERGLRTFIEVGEALREIRDSHLYRERYESFEIYCRQRWGFQASRARQLVAAAGTVTTVTAAGLPAPENERQARALLALGDDEAAVVAAYREALASVPDRKRLTAQIVKDAVARIEMRRAAARKAAASRRALGDQLALMQPAEDELEIHFPPAGTEREVVVTEADGQGGRSRRVIREGDPEAGAVFEAVDRARREPPCG